MGVWNVPFYGLPLSSEGKWYEPNNKLLSKPLGAAPAAGVLIKKPEWVLMAKPEG